MNAKSQHSHRTRPEGRRSVVLEALSRFRADYVRTYGVDEERLHVLDRLRACRTGALGTHLRVCKDCGWHAVAYNACRDRHCPQCQSRDAAAWAAAREARMLSVPHFQVVFTLPAELRPLAFAQPRVVYDLLLRTAASVLQDLFREHHEGRAGITEVLHTWTSEMTYHPHVHCLVTVGALQDDGSWLATREDYLFPQKVMGTLFRGRFTEALIDALNDGTLAVDDEPEVRRTIARVSGRLSRWVVHVEAPQNRGVGLITRYLARYVKRVAISDARIVSVTDTHVSFQSRRGLVRVSGAEFVHRFLLHVLPKGLRKVRHYGLYAPGASARLEAARAKIGQVQTAPEIVDEPEACPVCGSEVRRLHPPASTFLLGRLAALGSASARGPP